MSINEEEYKAQYDRRVAAEYTRLGPDMNTKLRSTCPHIAMAPGAWIAPKCKACGAGALQVIEDLQAVLLMERTARKLAIEALSEINRQIGRDFSGDPK